MKELDSKELIRSFLMKPDLYRNMELMILKYNIAGAKLGSALAWLLLGLRGVGKVTTVVLK